MRGVQAAEDKPASGDGVGGCKIRRSRKILKEKPSTATGTTRSRVCTQAFTTSFQTYVVSKTELGKMVTCSAHPDIAQQAQHSTAPREK